MIEVLYGDALPEDVPAMIDGEMLDPEQPRRRVAARFGRVLMEFGEAEADEAARIEPAVDGELDDRQIDGGKPVPVVGGRRTVIAISVIWSWDNSEKLMYASSPCQAASSSGA